MGREGGRERGVGGLRRSGIWPGETSNTINSLQAKETKDKHQLLELREVNYCFHTNLYIFTT